jgi:hypothetical protein
MHELGRPGRGSTRQVVHFAQENRIPPSRRIARNAAPVDTAPDNEEIEYPIQSAPRYLPAVVSTILLSFSQWESEAVETCLPPASGVVAFDASSLSSNGMKGKGSLPAPRALDK